MPTTIDVLVDTNILLRTRFDTLSQHTNASQALMKLLDKGETLATTVQNLAEFWNAGTRPLTANGLGLSIEETQRRMEFFEQSFVVLSESPASFEHWKRLLYKYQIRGTKVHDTRLVSIMMTFGIRRILTLNTDDFSRFPEITTLHPNELLSGS